MSTPRIAPTAEDLVTDAVADLQAEPPGSNLNGPKLPPQRRRCKTRRDRSRAARRARNARSKRRGGG